jgi:hypothetical protein
MALHGVKSSDNPSVVTDGVSTGEVQMFKEMVGTPGNETVLPSDATLGKAVYVTSLQGPTAVDAALTTEKPFIMGGRAFDLAPTKVSAEGDLQIPWLGTDGAGNTYVRIDGALVEAITNQPNPAAYVVGDVVGNVLQFNGAALANGRGLTINSVQCEDSTGTTAADINLALFCISPTSRQCAVLDADARQPDRRRPDRHRAVPGGELRERLVRRPDQRGAVLEERLPGRDDRVRHRLHRGDHRWQGDCR